MAKAEVTLIVRYEVEASEDIHDRMLNDFEDFYPSNSREEVWGKLAHWLGLNGMERWQCDGLADLDHSIASARMIDFELEEVREPPDR